MAKKRGRGRPPKAKSETRSQDLRIPVTAGEKQFFQAAARYFNKEMAEWVRSVLYDAVPEFLWDEFEIDRTEAALFPPAP